LRDHRRDHFRQKRFFISSWSNRNVLHERAKCFTGSKRFYYWLALRRPALPSMLRPSH
jgi:hypothetical protein